VYDYTGYGVSVDRRAVLRFYAVWGGRLEEWRRWRRSQSRSRNGDSGAEMRQDEGKNNGVRYSMDVFMAPMVFAKTTAATAASNAASSGKETSSSPSSPSSSSALNLPDNVYVCGDELDFIEDDATTIATASDNDHQYHQRTTSSSGRSRRSSSATSEPRDNSLLDIDDDYDNDDYDDYDDDMPSVTATCYENSTMHGGDDDDDTEDEVSLFTCGASCNEAVEHSSIVGGLEEEEYEEDDMMRDDPTSEFSASSSYHHHHHHHSSQSSSPRSISGGSTTTATVMSSSSQRRNSSQRRGRRRGHPNRQISIRAPLTPKQKRRALLRKHKWTMPSPSEEQCYGDIQLAYNYLLQIQEVPAKHVLLYGKSVGSGPTCWLAQRTCQSSSVGSSSSKDVAYDASGVGGGGGMMYEDVRDDGDVDYRDERVRGGAANVSVGGSGAGGSNNKSSLVGRSCDDDDAPGGVILHSPFLSVIRVVLDMGFTTVGDLFPNIDRVKDFTCLTYIIHGTQDEIVPYYHGQGLFNGLSDTSKAVPFWANGAGHNNIEMEMPTAYIKRLMQFVRQCDRLNYPAGELLRTRAFSSGSHGSGPKITTSSKQQRGGSSAHSQQELDSALHLPNNLHRKHTHTRQMMSSVSKQRKKKGHSNSPTMVVNTMNTTTPKRRQGGGGRSHRNSNNSISMEQQQVMMQHHGKYHHHQAQQQYQQHNHHQSARRDQYPSVVTNLSTDAAMCGIHEPSVESKYYTQYLQQQQQQQQQSSYY